MLNRRTPEDTYIEPALVIGSLRASVHAVRVSGERIPLSPRDLRVFNRIANEQGGAVSRAQMIKEGTIAGEGSLDHSIWSIRKEFANFIKGHIIFSPPHMGYSLNTDLFARGKVVPSKPPVVLGKLCLTEDFVLYNGVVVLLGTAERTALDLLVAGSGELVTKDKFENSNIVAGSMMSILVRKFAKVTTDKVIEAVRTEGYAHRCDGYRLANAALINSYKS